jgi:hypothetical protein
MEKDQFTGPDAPKTPQVSLSYRSLPTYSAHFSINGRHSPLLSRIMRPFGKLVFAWLEWRARQRARNDAPTS